MGKREGPIWSKNSCGLSLVVFEQATKPFTILKWACTLCVLVNHRKEQHVALALMIAFLMVMVHGLVEYMPGGAWARFVWPAVSCKARQRGFCAAHDLPPAVPQGRA